MKRSWRRAWPLALALPLLGARCAPIDVELGVPRTDGTLPVSILVQAGQNPATAVVQLDGVDVTGRFHVSGNTLDGSVPLPPPGASQLVVSTADRYTATFSFASPGPAPALAGIEPAPVAGSIPRTSWLRLRFAAALPAAAMNGPAFGVECGGVLVPRKAYRASGDAVILDPTPDLPPGASCRVAWRGPAGTVVQSQFQTAAAGAPPALVLHDRENAGLLAPYPDDYFTVTDGTTRTGRRMALPEPPYTGAVLQLYQAHRAIVNALDGFSRATPIVVGFSAPIDASSVPTDPFAAQDVFAPIALFDVDPASPDYGKRIPYEIKLRTDLPQAGSAEFSATLFPSINLRPKGRYALVVTRRLFADASPGRPLAPSAFFVRAMGAPAAGESAAVVRTREVVSPLLQFLETIPEVPISRDDVALALPLSIRSDDDIPKDLLAVKEDTLARPPPPLHIQATAPLGDGGAILVGTVPLPSYLDPVKNTFVHDTTTGRPVSQGTEEVPFVMRLPAADAPSPAPIVMYQHGTPGAANEVFAGGSYLTQAGFAVMGITDYPDRHGLGPNDALLGAILSSLRLQKTYPEFDKQTGADMIGFLRALQGLGGTAWRPPGAPQSPLLDTTRLLYHGISAGANHGLRFLAYAPEFVAATAGQGGGRGPEAVLHLDGVYLDLIPFYEQLVPGITPLQILVGFAISQQEDDQADPSAYARFVYRNPLTIAGLPGARAPSLLWTESIGDQQLSNNVTRAAAHELGIPTVKPLRGPSPVLTPIDAPLRANVSIDRTAGHFQYDPATTPGCDVTQDPHFCPTNAPIAQQQRIHFYQTALQGGAPEIADPLH